MRTFILFFLLMSILSGILAQEPAGRKPLSPALSARTNHIPAYPDSWDTLSIAVKDPASFRTLLAALPDTLSILSEYPAAGILVIRCRFHVFLQHILPLPGLLFSDFSRGRPKEEQALADQDLGLNTILFAHREFPSITGRGLLASIREDRFDTSDIDFRDRTVNTPLASTLYSTHATIMATIVGGAGNSFSTGMGAAPAASLASFGFSSLLPDPDSVYQQYDISVQNHSYGTVIENYYGNDAMAHDVSAINNPSLLHIFSAGNIGDQASATGTYAGIPGMANLTGNFKMAKNILTVGSTDSFGQPLALSSKGPAFDGRIKPELVAFGQDGSSGAAALVSGTCLLLQQLFRQQHGALPPSDLVRAILLNSTDDAGPPGVDYLTGYGSLNAANALHSLSEMTYRSGSLSTGEHAAFSISVPPGLRRLRITLCWNDPAASPNAGRALINDLDLQLVSAATEQSWLPWTLHSAPSLDSLMAPPVRGKDSLNNTEQISLDNPPAGDYTIEVNGYDISRGPQEFALAFSWDGLDSFDWTFPVAGSCLYPGVPNIIRWQTGLSGTAALQYSLDRGASWTLIDAAADLSKTYYAWSTPDTTAAAILRADAGGRIIVSDSFTISPTLRLTVGFNCPDSIFLFWNPIHGAEAYQVWQLTDGSLLPLPPTKDTAITLDKQAHPSLFYAVAPLLRDSMSGRKSYTVNYTTQGVDCYIRTFTADLYADAAAMLHLSMGTLYLVQGIRIEKKSSGGYIPLRLISPGSDSSLYWSVTDTSLTPGLNIYRAAVILEDGRIIYSDEQIVYYTGSEKYIVYPNPLDRGTPLAILAAGNANAVLQIFDVPGKKIGEYRLTANPAQIPTGMLARGLYFFIILENGQRVDRGKIIIK